MEGGEGWMERRRKFLCGPAASLRRISILLHVFTCFIEENPAEPILQYCITTKILHVCVCV